LKKLFEAAGVGALSWADVRLCVAAPTLLKRPPDVVGVGALEVEPKPPKKLV